MKIKKGQDGKRYVVFKNNFDAEKWNWLFFTILRRTPACFEQYENAYLLF